MIFAPELAAKITLGEKTVTRRPVKRNREERIVACTYQVGRVYAVQLMRGGIAVDHIRILSVVRETIEWPLTWTEARLEGFASPAAFAEKWRALYGPDGPLDVWRIEFEVAGVTAFRFKVDGFAWREAVSLAAVVGQLRAVPASEMVELEGPGISGRMFVADVFDLYQRSLGLGGGG